MNPVRPNREHAWTSPTAGLGLSRRDFLHAATTALFVGVGSRFTPAEGTDAGSVEKLPGSCRWRRVSIDGGGAIMTVSVSPHKSQMVLAGCDVGGVMRSEDGGRSWRRSNGGLLTDGDRAVAAFAWHPTRANVVYMGTGACFGRPQGPYGGLFRSDDEGRTWHLVSRETRFSGFGTYRQWGNVLKFHPHDGSLWAGTAWDGLKRSTDEGATWDTVAATGSFIVGLDWGPGDKWYVALLATRDNEGGVWIGSETERVWRKSLVGKRVRNVAADPSTPGRAYAVVQDTGVLVTDDAGRHWQDVSRDLSDFLTKQWGQAVAVNPTEPSTVYFAAGERIGSVPEWWRWRHPGLYVSRDKGSSWRPLTGVRPDGTFDRRAYLDNIDADDWWKSKGWFGFSPHGWAVEPQHGRALFMYDLFGVWASADGGRHWRAAMHGLATTVVLTVVAHPRQAGKVWFGLADVGLFVSNDAGRSVERLSFPSSDCTNLALETRAGTETLYTILHLRRQAERGTGSLGVSTDGGRTWRQIPIAPKQELAGVHLDPFRPHALYAGRWMTPDGGRSWRRLSLPTRWRGSVIPDPAQAGRLYAWNQGSVRVSTDSGRTWKDVSAGIPCVHPNRRVLRAFCVLPHSGRVLVGSDVHGLWGSDDAGATWWQLAARRYVSAIGADAKGRKVAVGTWRPWYAPATHTPGILFSTDGGTAFAPGDGSLGVTARPTVLTFGPGDSRVYLGTGGNAAFVGEWL